MSDCKFTSCPHYYEGAKCSASWGFKPCVEHQQKVMRMDASTIEALASGEPDPELKWQPYGMALSGTSHQTITIGSVAAPIITIHADGRVEVDRSKEPDHVARTFWEAVERIAPAFFDELAARWAARSSPADGAVFLAQQEDAMRNAE